MSIKDELEMWLKEFISSEEIPYGDYNYVAVDSDGQIFLYYSHPSLDSYGVWDVGRYCSSDYIGIVDEAFKSFVAEHTNCCLWRMGDIMGDEEEIKNEDKFLAFTEYSELAYNDPVTMAELVEGVGIENLLKCRIYRVEEVNVHLDVKYEVTTKGDN